MKKIISIFVVAFITFSTYGQTPTVAIKSGTDGYILTVNGKPTFINGMNWDYFPIGTNYNYNFWAQPDDFIKAGLDYEMPLLKNMGVNAVRLYTGVPSKWITYIYENYGIYTMLNHSFGRYGLTLKGVWAPNTDYSNSLVRDELLKETKALANDYKNTPGLLLFLLGNENNYGLFWRGAESENIPVKDRKSTNDAYHLYKLFNEAAVAMKEIDATHPIAICNGDMLFSDIIAKECTNVDIIGINSYRGISFTDLFDKAKQEFTKPILLTEFGADAYNTQTNKEDQAYQAKCYVGNWKEIYDNAAGMGKNGNCIGGFTFQFSDGWWKTGQTSNLDLHDVDASWSNGGYVNDYVPGENNMNEEWFGVCAKGATNEKGSYELYPRAAYYALKELHKFNPYTDAGVKNIAQIMQVISIPDATLRARSDKANLELDNKGKIYLSDLRIDLSTYNTGGSLISTPKEAVANSNTYPNRLGFDHMQSMYVGITAQPVNNLIANVQFNILGHVALNPIDEIFYENRGRPITVLTTTGRQQINSNNRLQLYRSTIKWDSKLFKLHGFYRTGHYHWGYEGDFFGLYQEANYGPNIDIYNGEAPVGFEIEAKKKLKGLKIAFGPELWWGANPAIIAKYTRTVAKANVTAMFQEDITQRSDIQSSIAVPVPKTRKAALSINRKFEKFSIDAGGLWAGQPLNGRVFQLVRETGGTKNIYQSKIKSQDNFGGKIKFTYSGGNFNWYGQAAYMGLVANAGPDFTKTFTGWCLKDYGGGNQTNVLTGFTFNVGKLQIAPNFLWQKPIEEPIPSDMLAPARPRNILDDPFAVRSNREQIAGELLLTYDPTPATWMYEWDNDRAEDAKFAMSADFIYRKLPTVQDAAIGILANGRTLFAFPGSAPAHNLWEVNTRIVSKLNSNLAFIANAWIGNAQANGNDARLIKRSGIDLRTIYKKMKYVTVAKFNDWGPFDYHRDFNLTYPLQLIADVSAEVGKPDWFMLPTTKVGIRGTYRTLNKYSPRYAPTYMLNAAGDWVPDPNAIGYPNGNEWEIRTYIQINIGK